MTQKEIECEIAWQIFEAQYWANREYWNVLQQADEEYNNPRYFGCDTWSELYLIAKA